MAAYQVPGTDYIVANSRPRRWFILANGAKLAGPYVTRREAMTAAARNAEGRAS